MNTTTITQDMTSISFHDFLQEAEIGTGRFSDTAGQCYRHVISDASTSFGTFLYYHLKRHDSDYMVWRDEKVHSHGLGILVTDSKDSQLFVWDGVTVDSIEAELHEAVNAYHTVNELRYKMTLTEPFELERPDYHARALAVGLVARLVSKLKWDNRDLLHDTSCVEFNELEVLRDVSGLVFNYDNYEPRDLLDDLDVSKIWQWLVANSCVDSINAEHCKKIARACVDAYVGKRDYKLHSTMKFRFSGAFKAFVKLIKVIGVESDYEFVGRIGKYEEEKVKLSKPAMDKLGFFLNKHAAGKLREAVAS